MMKKFISTLLTVFVSLFFLTTNLQAQKGKLTGGSEHSMPGWFKQSFLDLTEDVEEAKEEDKHVMLFMTLDFCPYCTKMINDNFVEGAKHQKYIDDNFDVLGINIKGSREIVVNEDLTLTEKEYADHLKIQYTPTIIILNQENEIAVRLNGYRSPENFKLVLDYVKNKEYKNMTLTQYLDKVKNKTYYTLKSNKMFKDIKDLSKEKGALAVIFEDGSCTQCDYFHNTTLKNKDVQKELSKVTVVRLDATSKEKIVTPEGKSTTAYDWAKEIKLDYRPGVLLYNQNKERARIDALLYSFHFKEMIRYVSGKYYSKYNTFLDYLGPRQDELLNQGINIDISAKN